MTIENDDLPVDESLLMGEDPPEDEPEDEPAPVEEPGAEPADDPAPPKDKDESDHIPKWRFNEINEERKALKEELERLKSARVEPAPTSAQAPVTVRSLRDHESELEAKLDDALYDGDAEQRKAIRAELRQVRDKIDDAVRSEAENRAEAKLSARMEQSAIQQAAEEIVAKHPILGDGGNADAVEMVVSLRDTYIANGVPAVKALKDAASKVVKLFGSEPSDEPKPVTPDPRKAEAIKRGVKVAEATPPKGGGVGSRAQEPMNDATAMSDSEWAKMSKTERERLLAG